VNEYDYVYFDFKADMVLACLSSLALGFIALIIFTDKRIQGHPNMIIAYTCLVDAFNFFNFFQRYVTCGYDLNLYYDKLFASTVQDPYYYVTCNYLNMCDWSVK
jgi:hypothetical protein